MRRSAILMGGLAAVGAVLGVALPDYMGWGRVAEMTGDGLGGMLGAIGGIALRR